MSNESFRNPADIFREEKKIAAIEDISIEVDEKIETFVQKEPHADNPEEAMAITAAEARETQLGMLSQFVFEIAEHGSYDLPFDLDDTGFAEEAGAFTYGGFPLRKDYAETAIKEGARQGTDDLLKMLVPSEITDKGIRDVYFLTWTKELLRRRFYIHDEEDGSSTVSFPTRLPNIEVTYTYPPNSRFPKRTIGLTKP